MRMVMNGFTRGMILVTTALLALLFGMALAAYSTPAGKVIPRPLTLSESLSRGAFVLPSDMGGSFASMFAQPDIFSRAFAPVASVTQDQSQFELALPVMVTNLIKTTVTTVVSHDVQSTTMSADTMKPATHEPKVTLKQIPYTGFDFGPFGNFVYWLSLAIFASSGAYLIIYNQSTFFRRIFNSIRTLAMRIDVLRGV